MDFLSGILVSYMIYTHIAQAIPGQIESLLYIKIDNVLFFFMPWFFYKSGMFYKHIAFSGESITKIRDRFLLPLIIFGIVSIPLFIISFVPPPNSPYALTFAKHLIYDIIIEGSLFGNAPLWFLISLSIIRLFVLTIKNDKLFLPISFCFLLLSFGLHEFHIRPIRIITPSLLGFFFFTMGYTFKKAQYNKLLQCISLIIFSLLFFSYPYHISIRSNEVYFYGKENMDWMGYFIGVIYSLCGIMVINNFIKLFSSYRFITTSRIYNFISSIGHDSMYYYVIHWIYLKLWCILLNYYKVELSFLYILIPLTLVISKKLHILDKYTSTK